MAALWPYGSGEQAERKDASEARPVAKGHVQPEHSFIGVLEWQGGPLHDTMCLYQTRSPKLQSSK